ncbi:MAG: tRNA lysidine(34) synthetase TilS [Pseudomonadota bacterium]
MTADPEANLVLQRVTAWLGLWSAVSNPRSPVAIAVSGGGDSIALLHAATDWARWNGVSLTVLTVDHGLRTESALEARFVYDLAGDLGWPCEVLRWENGRPDAHRARLGRHQLLATACQSRGIQHLMLGHTHDDQIETFLMRARQGSNWFGLGGMDRASASPAWPGGRGLTLIRPMLQETRTDLRAWLSYNGHRWVDDPTNADLAYERVRMRRLLHESPGLAGQVGYIQKGCAQLRRAEFIALAQAMETRVTCYCDASLDFDPTALSEERAVRVLGWLIQIAAGRAASPRDTKVREAYRWLTSRSGQARTLAGAWIISRPGATLSIYRDPENWQDPVTDRHIIDGRFEAIPERLVPPDLAPAARDGRAKRTMPRNFNDMKALTGPRLAHLCSIWRQLPNLSQALRL